MRPLQKHDVHHQVPVQHWHQHRHKDDPLELDDPKEADVSPPTIVLAGVEVVHFAVHERP